MLKLYSLINSLIEPICNCFVDHYPEGETKIYPYAEIRFPNVLPNNSYSDKNLLEIDVWNDKSTDIRDIETITDSINTALDRLNRNNEHFNVSINKNLPYRLSLADSEIHIQRRQLGYICTVYYK